MNELSQYQTLFHKTVPLVAGPTPFYTTETKLLFVVDFSFVCLFELFFGCLLFLFLGAGVYVYSHVFSKGIQSGERHKK